jgi:serine/threonine-protein kinase
MNQILNQRYQILQKLGEGGFGTTYLAKDRQMPSQRLCVIKQLKPIHQDPQTFLVVKERFKKEAAILEKLGENHPHIPQLYAYFELQGHFYLVQEYIEGETLEERIKVGGILKENTVKDILLGLLPDFSQNL